MAKRSLIQTDISQQIDVLDASSGELITVNDDGGVLRPAQLPGQWSRTDVVLPDGLDVEQWRNGLRAVSAVGGASMWWLGAFLCYGYGRYSHDQYDAAIALTGYERTTCQAARKVYQKVESCTRIQDLAWAHHQVVASRPQPEQVYWLSLASDNKWTVAQLRQEMKRAKTLAECDFPAGTFPVIYADPPWSYDNSGFTQSAASHYPTLSVDEICAFTDSKGRPIGSITVDQSVLFLWATSPLLPDAIKVMEAWGFGYKASMVWAKDRAPGMGWWVETRHELLLIGAKPKALQPAVREPSVLALSVGEHSAKPDEFYAAIERMFPASLFPQLEKPYCEVFLRGEPRDGWAGFGNQAVVS